MKTYHMYHAESISAESKLKEAEKQEEKQIGRSGDPVFHLRLEERHQRRSSVKKIEKMKEKVGLKLHRRALAPHMGRQDSRKNPDPPAIDTHGELLFKDMHFLPWEWWLFKTHKTMS